MGTPRPRTGARTQDAAFVRLYKAHYDHVYGYCRRRTGRASAEDAAAEVFTIAWCKAAGIPQGDKALPWLYGVAYRVLSNQWRSARRFRRLVARLGSMREHASPGPEEQVVRRAEDHRVLEAVSRLKRDDQEILRLVGWEELRHDEIAEVLDISVAAVAKRISRAKHRLAIEYDRAAATRRRIVREGGGR